MLGFILNGNTIAWRKMGTNFMANPNQGRKLLVRTALVTGATVATLIGAQSLSMLDASGLESEAAAGSPSVEKVTTTGEVIAAPQGETRHAAPSVIVLRRPGQPMGAAGAGSGSITIQPPNPVQLRNPDPVIMTQPSSGSGSGTASQPPVTSRSSR